MPELSRFLGIVIAMFHKDHEPAHFHAFYGEHEITIRISDGQVTGRFPRRAQGHVLEWYKLHKGEPEEAWQLAQHASVEANRATGVTMVRVTDARYAHDYVVWVRFSDGVEGEVDLARELDGPVFEPLRDPSFFRLVRFDPELHTIVWPNGADVAPEFLHSRVRVPA